MAILAEGKKLIEKFSESKMFKDIETLEQEIGQEIKKLEEEEKRLKEEEERKREELERQREELERQKEEE